MQETLGNLSDRDPERYALLRAYIIQAAEQWCKEYFKQSSAQVCEVGDVPVAYPGDVFGYRVVVEMPDYPQRELIEILIAPDSSTKGQHIL